MYVTGAGCMLLGQSLEGLYISRSVSAVHVDGHVAVHQHLALTACCHISLPLMDAPGNVGLNNLFLQEFDFIMLFYHKKRLNTKQNRNKQKMKLTIVLSRSQAEIQLENLSLFPCFQRAKMHYADG